MTETQQILEALKRLEKGQKSIRSEMATKAELYQSHEALASKLDTMQSDITTMQKDITKIRENTEVGTNQQSDEENALKIRVTRIEKHLNLPPISLH